MRKLADAYPRLVITTNNVQRHKIIGTYATGHR
jgi:hypothetical protein